MKRRSAQALTIVCAILSPLASATAATVDDLAWLGGCWTSRDGKRETAEHWLKPAGGTMLGVNRTVMDGKTTAFEFMRIAQEANGDIYFIAKPSGQGEARFKLVKSSAREVVFANPEHDFPQRIIYRLLDDGSLLGRIEGENKGQEKAVDFPMKRASCDS